MFYWELEEGGMTISSHETGRACVCLALQGRGVSWAGRGDRGKLCGCCLFLLPWLKAALCAAPTWRFKTSTLSKGDDVSRGKKPLACSSPPVWLWLSLCSQRALPPSQCTVPSLTGQETGTGGCCHGLGEKDALPALQRVLPWAGWGMRHLYSQAAWKEGASPGSPSAWVRDAGAERRSWAL